MFGSTQRNFVIGPNYIGLDASCESVAIKDDVRLPLAAETCNVTNRPNFGLPENIFGATNFAVISTASDSRQMQLSSKLPFGLLGGAG